MVILADREKLWPRLEKLGEKKVRAMLAANEIESFEEKGVEEWLNRRAALDAVSDAKTTKWVAVVSPVAAVIAAIAGVVLLFK